MKARLRRAIVVGCLLLMGCAAPAAPGPPNAGGERAGMGASAAATGGAGPSGGTVAASDGATPAPPRESAKLVVTSISLSATPHYIARDLGFWAEEGIDTELVLVPGAAQPAQALVAGEVQFIAGAGASTVPSSLEGAALVVLAVTVNTFPNVIMSPTLQRMDELKGKRLGITRRGAATDFAARYALPRFGLQPDTDVALIPLGDGPSIAAGLESDAADAGVLSDFQIVSGRRRGLHTLADVGALGVEYSQTGQVTSRRIATERADYVRRYLRGWLRGLAYFATNREGTLPIAAKVLDTTDLDLLDAAYRDLLPYVQRIPYPRPGGIQTVLDTLVATQPKAATARPEEFYDDSFLRELEANGFFKALYGE
jgi:NitT/TauT family transport system substrate-binding protein